MYLRRNLYPYLMVFFFFLCVGGIISRFDTPSRLEYNVIVSISILHASIRCYLLESYETHFIRYIVHVCMHYVLFSSCGYRTERRCSESMKIFYTHKASDTRPCSNMWLILVPHNVYKVHEDFMIFTTFFCWQHILWNTKFSVYLNCKNWFRTFEN